jgi:glycosyltransferase involved in cell wall biosynthesis
MSNVMRIGIVARKVSREGGGVSESIRLLTESIVDLMPGKIEIFSSSDSHFFEDRNLFKGVEVKGFKAYGPDNFSFCPGLLRALIKADLDILHVHGIWSFHCLAAFIWHLRTGRPYVITPHGMMESWIRKRSQLLKKTVSALYQDSFFRRASIIHTLTEKEVLDVTDVYGELKTKTIPNYVPVAREELKSQRPCWWRDEFDSLNIFLFFGRIHEKKGCLELCEAWVRRCEADSDFSSKSLLVFCGWVDGLPELEKSISVLSKKYNNVIFVGPQYGAEKWRSFAAASFMVLPSKSEGLPMAVLEAWSAGVPVLMTHECNLDIGFERGAAVPIGSDVFSIDKGLKDMFSLSVDDRAVMSCAAKSLVSSEFSKERIGSQLMDIYKSMVDR